MKADTLHDVANKSETIYQNFCTVAPFDMMRTRLMNQPTDAKLYNGFADCFTKVLKNEGPLAFYRGFLPIWGRFAPQATLQLLVFEQMLRITGYSAL